MTERLTVRGVEPRLLQVPLRRALHTSASRITAAPLLLIDVLTEQGVTGRAYLFCYVQSIGRAAAAIARSAATLLAGTSAQPAATGGLLRGHFRLAGVTGPVASVVAAVDVACWDALAIAAGLPLVRLLGGEPRPIPAYNSNGLGLQQAPAVADEALELVAEGFRAVKIRLGRPTPADDVAAVRAVRSALPDDVTLMADFNQALSSSAAGRVCRRLDDEGLEWIEEPIRHDDYAGAALIARELAVPVQIGENFSLIAGMQTALNVKACDLVMPDLERIGGVSGWQQAAAFAEKRKIKMSSHLYPETSAHLLAVTPTAHFLEYVDWADKVIQEPLQIVDGEAVVPDRPGHGIVWDKAAVERYRV
jgi:mandelate racemase